MKEFSLKIEPESPLEKIRCAAKNAERLYWEQKDDPLARAHYAGKIVGYREALALFGVMLEES